VVALLDPRWASLCGYAGRDLFGAAIQAARLRRFPTVLKTTNCPDAGWEESPSFWSTELMAAGLCCPRSVAKRLAAAALLASIRERCGQPRVVEPSTAVAPASLRSKFSAGLRFATAR
jgi:hypothetical protein